MRINPFQKFFTKENFMKWVLLVVILHSDGSIEKVMNGGQGWEDRNLCRILVEQEYQIIAESVYNYFPMPQEAQIIGVGCYQPQTNQEDMVKIFE